MDVNVVKIKDYTNLARWRTRKNKANSKPKETARIQNTEARRQKNRLRDGDTSLKKQSQFANTLIGVTFLSGNDYGKISRFPGRKNKANSKPI